MYITVIPFVDLQDNNHKYNIGDDYPRDGYTPTDERIEELSTEKNKRGEPLIKCVKEGISDIDTDEPVNDFYDNVEEYVEDQTDELIETDTDKENVGETEEYTGNVNEIRYNDPDTE